MHTITECPRCKKDFMYHQTDTHLHREEPVSDQDLVASENRDNSNGAWNTKIVICQDCHELEEIENIANFIEEKSESKGWENAEYMAGDKFGVEKTLKAIRFLDQRNHIKEVEKDFPLKDDQWPSRRWNKDRTNYCDL